MNHKHSIYDSDPHFSISPITRAIKNESSKKTTVMQNDHNSERFTFEMPRFIEGHDMLLCDKVEVHYINVSNDKTNKTEDVYHVNDVQLSPDSEDEDVVIFSWLISGNATKYAGNLSFLISFKCLKDEVIDYAWHTDIHKTIAVGEGMNLTEAAAFEYSDILASWESKILKQLEEGIVRAIAEANAYTDRKTANLGKPTEGLKYLSCDEYCVVIGIGTATDTDIIIPSEYNGIPVTEIGVTAFDGNTNITSITIPDSVTKIESYAFKGCTNLKSIFIPASVTDIGYQAFEGCTNLTIYCEAESHPSGWSVNWNRYNQSNTQANCPVVWGYAADLSSVNDKLKDKLDKTTTPSRLYGTNANGAQTLHQFSHFMYPYWLVARGANKELLVPENPLGDDWATSKKFVTDLVNPIAERVSELENLTLDHSKITSTGYEIPVPSEVGSSALVKMIGGATEKVVSKNLVNPKDIPPFRYYGSEEYVTPTVNADGSISFTLYSETYAGAECWADFGLSAGKYYYLVEGADTVGNFTYALNICCDIPYDEVQGYPESADFNVKIMFYKYEDSDTVELTEAPEGTVFEPYHEPYFQDAEVSKVESIGADGETLLGSITIPFEAIKARVDGFGMGIDSTYNNRIEWVDDKVNFIESCRIIILDGDENWKDNSRSGSNKYFYFNISTIIEGVCLCDKYEKATLSVSNNTVGVNVATVSGSLSVLLRPENADSMSIDDFKKQLIANPVSIMVALKNPSSTDITDLFTEDNSIEVEGGGELVLVNEHEMAVPNTIAYVTRKG